MRQGISIGLNNEPPEMFDGKITWGGFSNGGYFAQPCQTAGCENFFGIGFAQYRFSIDFSDINRPVKMQIKNDNSHPSWGAWFDACSSNFINGSCNFALVGGSRLWIDAIGVNFNNSSYVNTFLWAK